MRISPEHPPLRGRDDAKEAPDALRIHQSATAYDAQHPQAPGKVLIGFACDAGVIRNLGRSGAKAGPNAIRGQLGGLALHSEVALYDAGDIVCEGDKLEEAQAELGELVGEVLSGGHLPIVVGGGHEVAFGTFTGLWRFLGQSDHRSDRLAIINLDAHFDLRASPVPSSGTPFAQIAKVLGQAGKSFNYYCLGVSRSSNTRALFRIADELAVHYAYDYELQETPHRLIDEIITSHDSIYLSIDLDVLPASTMPAVSAPAAFGVPLKVVEEISTLLLASEKIVAIDIAEYSPPFDIDLRGARVAARLIHSLLD